MTKIILFSVFIGCSSTVLNDIPAHPLYDRENKLHIYNRKVSLDTDRYNYYCQKHFEWENIITIYTENGREYKII